MIKKIVVLAIPVFFFAPALSQAADRWVSTTGDNTANDCLLEASPCATINYAIGQSADGDTIRLADGTYDQQVDLSAPFAGNLTIRGASRAGTIIRGAASWAALTPFDGTNKAIVELGTDATGLVTIQDLTINGSSLQPACSDPAYANYYGVFTAGKPLSIQNTTIQNVNKADPSTAPDPGCVETSSSLYATATTSGTPRPLSVSNSLFENFLKYGATVSGTDWNVSATSLSVDGVGSVSARTRTGLLLGDDPLGSDATPTSVTVSNSSVSNLLYGGYNPASPDVLSKGIEYKKDAATARTFTVQNTTLDDTDAGVFAEGQIANVGNLRSLLSGNTFSGAYRSAAVLNGGLARVFGNTFLPDAGTRQGVSVWSTNATAPDVEVVGNSFRNGAAGQVALGVQADAPLGTAASIDLSAEENSFVGYDPVYSVSGSSVVPTVDLEKNWWGCNTGPGAGCSTTGGPTVAGWLQLAITSKPSKLLLPGGSSTVAFRMIESGGTGDSSLATNFPEATVDPITVSPLGTITNSSLNLVGGEASTTLTRGAETGTTTVNGTLNGATSNLEVGFWQALDNTVAPSITGTGVIGQALTVSPGTWTGVPAPAFSYQWQIGSTASGPWQDISGATTTTYTPVAGDAGKFVRVRVLATSAAGNVTTNTASFAILQVAPSDLLPPRIYGTPQVGNTLSSFPGVWVSVDSPALTYQWQRSADGTTWEDIPGATASEYTVTEEDFGQSLRVNVSAATTGGTQTVSSAAVEVFSFALSATKTVSGRPVAVGAGVVPVARVACSKGDCQIESATLKLRARKKNVSGGSLVFETGTWSGGEKIISLQAPDALLFRLAARKSGLLEINLEISSSNGSVLERNMRLGLRL